MSTKEISYALGKVRNSHPDIFKLYREYADSIWKNNTLNSHDVELIAVSVTHATKCSYCVEYHTSNAKKVGVTLEELIEGALISTSIETGDVYSHQLDEISFDHFLLAENDIQTPLLSNDLLIDLLRFPFLSEEGVLSKRLKILIALSVSYAIKSQTYMNLSHTIASKENIDQNEVAASIHIASALKAGSTIRHLADVYNAYEE